MKIEKKTILNLTHDNVIKIIEEYLTNKGYTINDMEFNIKKKQWTEGYGATEIDYEKLVFEGVRVDVNEMG